MVGRVAEVYNITSRDETDLVRAIGSVGPVSVAFQVAEDFRLYSHGVYDSYDSDTNHTVCKSGKMDVNHAVVAVGYGVSEADEVPFYIVRNSWGNTIAKVIGIEGVIEGEEISGTKPYHGNPKVIAEFYKQPKKENCHSGNLDNVSEVSCPGTFAYSMH